MEGLFFYWLTWMGWIVTTFFMDKNNPERLKVTIWLLLLILAAPYNKAIFTMEINLSALIIVALLLIETRGKKLGEFLNLFTSSFIIMLAYTSFLLYELLDPVWVLIDRRILLTGTIVYLVLLLQRKGYNRALVLISGTLQGEVLYALVMEKQGFSYLVSSLRFLDILVISVGTLFVWTMIETVLSATSGSIIKQAEGEEHKSS